VTERCLPFHRVLLQMMEPPIPVDGDGDLYQKFLSEVAADLQPKNMVEWIRVLRLVQCEWHAARVRRYRSLMLAGHRGQLLHEQIVQDNNARRRKRTRKSRRCSRESQMSN
jgi:hypothetical protein